MWQILAGYCQDKLPFLRVHTKAACCPTLHICKFVIAVVPGNNLCLPKPFASTALKHVHDSWCSQCAIHRSPLLCITPSLHMFALMHQQR